MRHRIFVHVTWTTRDRKPLIDFRIESFLRRYLRVVCAQERCELLALGLVQTHVHALIRLHPTAGTPRLVQRMKGGSATVANREGHASSRLLKWEKGYNIESVSRRALGAVMRYIRNQPAHHPDEAIGVPAGESEVRAHADSATPL